MEGSFIPKKDLLMTALEDSGLLFEEDIFLEKEEKINQLQTEIPIQNKSTHQTITRLYSPTVMINKINHNNKVADIIKLPQTLKFLQTNSKINPILSPHLQPKLNIIRVDTNIKENINVNNVIPDTSNCIKHAQINQTIPNSAKLNYFDVNKIPNVITCKNLTTSNIQHKNLNIFDSNSDCYIIENDTTHYSQPNICSQYLSSINSYSNDKNPINVSNHLNNTETKVHTSPYLNIKNNLNLNKSLHIFQNTNLIDNKITIEQSNQITKNKLFDLPYNLQSSTNFNQSPTLTSLYKNEENIESNALSSNISDNMMSNIRNSFINHTRFIHRQNFINQNNSMMYANNNSNMNMGLSNPSNQIDKDATEEEVAELEDQLRHIETYAEYIPKKLRYGCQHPDSVVETNSLSSVEPPGVWYTLSLPETIIDTCALSALQLESIIYACQQHETLLPDGSRAGFLIGDGPGVGKGRTIAGIIYENYLLRRKRAIWFSVSNDLKYDAERDLKDIDAGKINVSSLNKFKYKKLTSKSNGSYKKGVIFATYSSLIGESQTKSKYNTRMKQLLHWCGKDFDGVIVFDECHKAKNLTPSGSSKPTKTGLAVLELQNRLPLARVVYASATGATETKNMGYMVRLGIWGRGTPFPLFSDFILAVERRGVGAMELVAMDMKLRGTYMARQLSFAGVTFTVKEAKLDQNIIDIYDASVLLWAKTREKFQLAMDLMDNGENISKKQFWSQFWAAHQRFFKYLCLAAKVNLCVELTKKALKDGKCVVIGLQTTGEARTLEQIEDCGGEINDFISTAKGVLQSLVEKHFPSSTNYVAPSCSSNPFSSMNSFSKYPTNSLINQNSMFTSASSAYLSNTTLLNPDRIKLSKWTTLRNTRRAESLKDSTMTATLSSLKAKENLLKQKVADVLNLANSKQLESNLLISQTQSGFPQSTENSNELKPDSISSSDTLSQVKLLDVNLISNQKDGKPILEPPNASLDSSSSSANSSPEYLENDKEQNDMEDRLIDENNYGDSFSDPDSNRFDRTLEDGDDDYDKYEDVGSNPFGTNGNGFNMYGSGDEFDEEIEPWLITKRKKQYKNRDKKRKKIEMTDNEPPTVEISSQNIELNRETIEIKQQQDDSTETIQANSLEDVKDIEDIRDLLSSTGTDMLQYHYNGFVLPSSQCISNTRDNITLMRQELLAEIEELGERLPPNTLDQLIEELGGPEQVAEMTGRKGRVVAQKDGTVIYESRGEIDVPLEALNVKEKQRFMDGLKKIAIISEAASSGISLQSDRRVLNQLRRVHITLELPWSADKAIQQFGRTHRSNQVSAPEYIFLLSKLAGEKRFASIVAKRLESLGALTHGDRRATESRDLSQFNFDNKYGRMALDSVMRSILSPTCAVVDPPEYNGNFFKDALEGLIAVGLVVKEREGCYSLDKDYANIVKFLNRILGLKVILQNTIFQYFTDSLNAYILDAKRTGKWDMGILDFGTSGESITPLRKQTFHFHSPRGVVSCQLWSFQIERGLQWEIAVKLYRDQQDLDDGFFVSKQAKNGIYAPILALSYVSRKALNSTASTNVEKLAENKLFNIYRPNTGLQGKLETLASLTKKYRKVPPQEAQEHWENIYNSSLTQCTHVLWKGSCKKKNTTQGCEIGIRTRKYHLLAGSVLTVWNCLEELLSFHSGSTNSFNSNNANSSSAASKMQIIRLKTKNDQRIVGIWIRSNYIPALVKILTRESDKTDIEDFIQDII
ncbi:unnamed protein product [Gordionus sp. m RMFG-2023]|uniref:protein strawberry notch homolog 1-like isoform X2 n=1 Tax=Gordionus sp. m RMFG-2023 TaxID=3053472 RepID=UPI0030E4F61A